MNDERKTKKQLLEELAKLRRQTAEHEPEVSESRYRNLFDSSKDAIAINGPEGNLIDCNQAYLELVGYTKQELLSIRQSALHADADRRTELLQESISLPTSTLSRPILLCAGMLVSQAQRTWRVRL